MTAVSRLRRFLHIERSRTERPEADAEPAAATAGRFGTVERPGARPQAPRSSGAELDRFGPEPDPAIELVETAAGEQPFTRCVRCGMDHGVFATECSGCGASLDTAAAARVQRAALGSGVRRRPGGRPSTRPSCARSGFARATSSRRGDGPWERRSRARWASASGAGSTGSSGGGAFGWDAAARLLRRLLRGAGG